MRTLHGSRCFRVKSVRVIMLCSLPSRSLMSLLNIPHCSFPQVLPSPACSRYRPPASTTSIGRREKPCEPARWSVKSGRMVNPAPNTGHEPKPSNFFSYVCKGECLLHLIFTNIWLRHTDMNNLDHIANNGTGHHKAHGRVQCAVLSTPRTVC